MCMLTTATNSPFKFSFFCKISILTFLGIPLNTNSLTFVSSLHIEIDLSGKIFSTYSKNVINLWLETKNIDVFTSLAIFLTKSSNFLFDFGTKP